MSVLPGREGAAQTTRTPDSSASIQEEPPIEAAKRHPLGAITIVAVAAAGVTAGAIQMLVIEPKNEIIERLDKDIDRLRADLSEQEAKASGFLTQVDATIKSTERAIDEIPKDQTGEESSELKALRERVAVLEALRKPQVAVPAEVGEATGEQIIKLAETKIGQPYILGARAQMANSKWNGPWDNAEFVSWIVYQVSHRLVGTRPSDDPISADAFTGFWVEDADLVGKKISVEEAAKTRGAILVRAPVPNQIGHIAISDGNGGTIEAYSSKTGVVRSTVANRRWDFGLLLNDVAY